MDEATQQSTAEGVKVFQPHLELQILSPDKPEMRLPFYAQSMPLQEHAPGMLAEPTLWCLECDQERARLVHPSEAELPLQPGHSVLVEGAHLTLLDLRRPWTALLSGMDGLSWSLLLQRYQVGRRGRRLNHIELNDPTISRQQATLIPTESGGFKLLCESASSPTVVNERKLEPGVEQVLRHGDLIRLGNLQFRYMNHQEEKSGRLFDLKTLGSFSMELDGRRVASEGLSAKTRWLIGMLGLRWGEPVAVESIIGQFWPKASTSRARKNLGVALKQFRECLDMPEEEFGEFLIRTRTQLKLNPNRLGNHDLVDLKALISEGAISSAGALERFLVLYRGAFMEGCLEDWALKERSALELEVSRSLAKTVAYFGEQGQFELAGEALRLAIQLDPTHQEPLSSFMKAALEGARPELAVRTYEELQAKITVDGLEPDVAVVKMYYRARSGI